MSSRPRLLILAGTLFAFGESAAVSIEITAPRANDNVSANGFLVNGRITQASGAVTLTGSISSSAGASSQTTIISATAEMTPPRSRDARPVANDDQVSAAPGTAINIDVLANDTGLGDRPIRVSFVNRPSGRSRINTDNSIRWIVPNSAQGTTTFSYSVRDADGDSSTATVRVNHGDSGGGDSGGGGSTGGGDLGSLSDVEISTNGLFTYVVPPNTAPSSGPVTVTLTVRDGSGDQDTATLNLNVKPAAQSVRHLLNRVTFGPTPDLMEELRNRSFESYIDAQLNPRSIAEDPALATHLNRESPTRGVRQLQFDQVGHAIYSRRQLLEVMTVFWENHFNTSSSVNWEVEENEDLRDNALGRFRDLLDASAKSPAMLHFLDNFTSVAEAPNENYSRELLELHTMGVNGGYTSQDVVEVARAFTGWTERDNVFTFIERSHDADQKVVLGHVIRAGGGQSDGEFVLDILAEHPSTHRFICTKLARKFISDRPDAGTIEDCARVFQSSRGDISEVLRALLTSPAFTSASNYRSKYKTPLEFVVGMIRALEMDPGTGFDYLFDIEGMGMELFAFPVPIGYGEIADKWISSHQWVARVGTANTLAHNESREGVRTYVDLMEFFGSKGYQTAQGILGYLFLIATDNNYTATDWQAAYAAITNSGNVVFDINDRRAKDWIRLATTVVFSLPQAHTQ